MKTYRGTGKRIYWTNDTGSDQSSGAVAVIGDRIAILVTDIASLASGSVETEGIHELKAASADVFAIGDQLYWDATNLELTTTSYVNTKAGFAAAAKAALAVVGRVKLNA